MRGRGRSTTRRRTGSHRRERRPGTQDDVSGAYREGEAGTLDVPVIGVASSIRHAPAGRVLGSIPSEHRCDGRLESYLLTGHPGLFNSFEALTRIVDSKFSQHAKWLKVTLELPWERKIASLSYLLASHVWQQDHNSATHQNPGFLDHVQQRRLIKLAA